MLLPRHAIFIFGALACASAGIIANEQQKQAEDDEAGLENDDSREIFAHEASSIIHRSAQPFYYVSYDLYENVCTDERCNDVADLLLKSLNKSVNPCDDFYAYSCGRKESKMRSPTKEIQEILEQQSDDKEEMKSLALEKKLYRSCMRQQETDHKTRREFSRLLELSNGLALFRREMRLGVADWQSIDGLYASLGFEHAFFNIHVTRDPDNADVNLIAMMPPSPTYIFAVHTLLKRKNIMGIISHLLDEHKVDGEPYVTDYDDVIDFNHALHEILPPLVMFEENFTSLKKNKMTIEQWQRIYDENEDPQIEDNKNHANWHRIINNLLKSTRSHLESSEKIVLNKIDYFAKLAQLLEKTSPILVEKYIHFKFLSQISKYLSPSLARYYQTVQDRSAFCIKQSDNQLIGATYEYIKRHVPHEHKISAETIIENIRNSLINLLSHTNWMDKETVSYATNKLKNLDMIVGYPDWQTNHTFVNTYYGNLHLHSHSFFENVIKYKRWTLVNELHGLKHPNLFDPVTMSKKIVPLIYYFDVNSHTNRIIFPTEYLNEEKYKLFSTKLPSAVNYGSFASMLGSILYDYISLTDDLKYDQFYTRIIEGLSKDTIDAYKEKEVCLTNQLTNYKKFASKFKKDLAYIIDGNSIQVDKIYEKMVGLRAAFEAYKKVRSDGDRYLPGFEDTSDYQLFFMSYAARICEIGDIYDKYDAYETSLKVNGVVSNLEAFTNVFHCPKHSPMDREVKCELFP